MKAITTIMGHEVVLCDEIPEGTVLSVTPYLDITFPQQFAITVNDEVYTGAIKWEDGRGQLVFDDESMSNVNFQLVFEDAL